MLPLDDERWTALEGGSGPYDPRQALADLREGDESAWGELWSELYHQGDVGTASYAVVAHLVDIYRNRDVPNWRFYALLGAIEIHRTQGRNPRLPEWLRPSYDGAWQQIVGLGCRDLSLASDETTVRAILAAIALAKGVRPLGRIMLDFTADELAEMIQSYDVK